MSSLAFSVLLNVFMEEGELLTATSLPSYESCTENDSHTVTWFKKRETLWVVGRYCSFKEKGIYYKGIYSLE